MDSELRTLLIGSFDKLLEQHQLPKSELVSRGNAADAALWTHIVASGFLDLFREADAGGVDGDLATIVSIMTLAGRRLLLLPLLDAGVVAPAIFKALGRLDLLQDDERGARTMALACWRPLAECALETMPIATASAEGWTLDGTALALRMSHGTQEIVTIARCISEGRILVLKLPIGQPCIGREDFIQLDGTPASRLSFSRTPVASDQLLGELSEAGLKQVSAITRMALAAELVGLMSEMAEGTAAYVSERVQFGRPLADKQVVRHKLADLAIHVEQAVSALQVSVENLDHTEVLAASLYRILTASRQVSQLAIQLHGGIGTTNELWLGHYIRRAMAIEILLGSAGNCLTQYEDLRWPAGASEKHRAAASKIPMLLDIAPAAAI